MNRLAAGFVLCLAFGLLAGGCAPAKFKEPLANYQQSVATSTAVLEAYYSGLNQADRTEYLSARLYNPQLEVLIKQEVPTQDPLKKKQSEYTPLIGSGFSPAGIKVRMDLLNHLAVLGQRLSELAGNTAPTQSGASLQALSGGFFSLVEKINKAAGTPDSMSSYADPVGKLLNMCMEAGMTIYRDKQVAEFIKQSKDPVMAILNALDADLTALGGLTADQYLEQVKNAASSYNKERRSSRMTFAEREHRLEMIDLLAQKYVAAQLNNPADLVKSMKKSFIQLADYAEHYTDVKSLERLKAELSAQADFVSQFAEQVAKIVAINPQ
ncbi:hypothetical protein [Fundidesulfovibrio soli]|uniref:hypothetical protein n=1 Tax=Fundidesulfovibrio soli TaxID=2922716 RepID=UPI001FAEC070|nr:hypothetical protein [Fundidesulfovibrio soli]